MTAFKSINLSKQNTKAEKTVMNNMYVYTLYFIWRRIITNEKVHFIWSWEVLLHLFKGITLM